jgi:hypothetical protein
MNDLSRRSWSTAVAVTFACAALAAASSAGAATFGKPAQPGPPANAASPGKGSAAHGAGTGEGIVQSVSAGAIVLRELDGSTVSVPVGSSTHVFVDGKKASIRDVKVGFVASATWKAGKPAPVLKVFNLSGPHAVTVGIVDSVSTGGLVVTGTGGTTVSISVNSKTLLFVDGLPAKLAAVKAGYTVVITAKDSKGGKPAHELRFLRPG